jgi:hypothetical protein
VVGADCEWPQALVAVSLTDLLSSHASTRQTATDGPPGAQVPEELDVETCVLAMQQQLEVQMALSNTLTSSLVTMLAQVGAVAFGHTWGWRKRVLT